MRKSPGPALFPFSPLGRTDRRTLDVTASDLDVLRGVPEPLRVLVLVTIDR